MDVPLWVVFSVVALAGNVGKVLTVKTLCAGIDSRLVVFSSRVVAAAVLVPMLWAQRGGLPTDGVFWGVIAVTSLITVVSSLLFTESIRKGPLTVVMPMQASVPVFAVLTLWAVHHERLSTGSIVWMLTSMSAVAAVLYSSHADRGRVRRGGSMRYAFYSVAAAVLFGISTVLDRSAVVRMAHGGLAYAACWNLFSMVLMFGVGLHGRVFKSLDLRTAAGPMLAYGLAAVLAFYAQMAAVERSLGVPGGVVHVKTIVMLHLPVVVLVGYAALRERVSRRTLATGLAAILAGFMLVRTMIEN